MKLFFLILTPHPSQGKAVFLPTIVPHLTLFCMQSHLYILPVLFSPSKSTLALPRPRVGPQSMYTHSTQ